MTRSPIRARAAVCLWILALVSAGGCASVPAQKPKVQAASNEVTYQRAKDLLQRGKYEKSRQVLGEIGTRETVAPELDPLVKIALADAYYYDPGITNLIDAQSRYAQFLTYYPSSPLAAYAQFQVAMCYYKQSPRSHHDQGYTRKAIEEFDKVVKLDPGHRFTLASDVMRLRCMDKLAYHDYQVGVFYFKRKAYDGSATRFRRLLDNYPGYQKKDSVYYYLGMSLIRSGNPAEGRVYLEKLRRDYSEGRFGDKARSELSKFKNE